MRICRISRRPLATLLAGLTLIVLAACETEPPTEVNYFDATVQAKVGCVDTRGGGTPAYDAQWRIAYRLVGAGSWSLEPWHDYSCPDEQAPHYLAGSPFSEQLTDLRQNRQYEYRLEIQHPSGAGYQWRDKNATENGTDYDRFTTDAFPTVTPKSARSLRESFGINTRLAYAGPYGNCAKTIEAAQYIGAYSLRDGLWPSYDPQWSCFRNIGTNTNLKLVLGLGDLVNGSTLQTCWPPSGARSPYPAELQIGYGHCTRTLTQVVSDGPGANQVTVQSAAGLAVGQQINIMTNSQLLAGSRTIQAISGNVVTYSSPDVTATSAHRLTRTHGNDDVRTFEPNRPGNGYIALENKLDHLDNDPASHNNAPIREAIVEWEGVNEPDWFTPFVNWPDVTEAYQQWLWNSVRTRPGFNSPKISGPSFATGGGYDVFDDGSLGPYMDYCTLHPYPGDGQPGASITSNKPYCDAQAPGKSIAATEYGYHQEIQGVDGGGQWNLGVNPAVQASYTMRALLEHERRGIARTDFFTIVENWCGEINDGNLEEADWGWYDCNWNPKPVAHAMHNLTTTIGDGTPALTPLPWRVDTRPANYQEMVFRRSDGAYVVAVWRNEPLWDEGDKQPASVPPQAFKATVPDATSIHYVTPLSSSNEVAAPYQNRELQFILHGDPILFVIR